MISVCIATYNASEYIIEQVVSILQQLDSFDEVVISDDASTDNTISLIRNIGDSRIKLIANNNNVGVVKNFERALRQVKGDIVFLSDQDDIWLPDKVLICCEALQNYTLVVSDCIVVDGELNQTYKSFFKLNGSKKGVFHNLQKNGYMGCCMAFKKELLTNALPFPQMVSMHDIWLGLVAELTGNVTFLPQPLVMYRRHSSNVSGLKSKNSFYNKLINRITIIYLLLIRCFFFKPKKNSYIK